MFYNYHVARPEPSSNEPSRAGRPPSTSRAEILDAARAVIDRDGWDRLTIRRLAAEAGVSSTTVYHHVKDRQDLLLQLLDDHISQHLHMDLPVEPRDRIVAAFRAIHDTLASWPRAAEVLTVDGLLGLLGPDAVGAVEVIVAGAVDCGCTPEQAVHLFRSLWYYTVGELVVRSRSAATVGAVDPGDGFNRFDPEQVPHLAGIGGAWPALAARDTYATGLVAFLDGLLADLTRPR